jgi:sigma-54 dependent transcriptional regulator, acetoin dehydrogenase operon transcriptional activator AcoR
MIQRSEFRQDLYYRLNGLVVRLPPLRDRCDIAALVERILETECAVTSPLAISDEVLTLFRRCLWPGNVRQLANVLRTAAVMAADEGDTIQRQHLPDDFMEELRSEQLLAAHCAAEHPPGARAPASDACSAPAEMGSAETDGGSLKERQTSAVRSALDQYGGNVSAAARALGVSRNTIYRALRVRGCSETEQGSVSTGALAQNENNAH